MIPQQFYFNWVTQHPPLRLDHEAVFIELPLRTLCHPECNEGPMAKQSTFFPQS